ncbi:hypothetical protein SAMN02745823_03620 [Sporobacter termitidis DSM 10068]|uniref:Lipoprotein n=1 Tax=Sporobacter termitidis DSM 10068 TaxID=1123282 RepID=A0A1M5ZEK6_9FIRM|nr:hypothetical protein [Sporobacter termitidis]SHI22660.1 hypothetical protein SAMN02745823_03620 [Sporobacter termitidis DSM 10068]
MKKAALLLLVFALLSIAGCSNSAAGADSKITPTPENTGASNAETASPDPTPSVSFLTPASPSAAAPSGDEQSPAATNNPSSSDGVSAALGAYKAVLENKSEFYSTESKKNVLFDDFLANKEIYGIVFKPERFAILDMDGDKVPEVVIELQAGEFFEVLHYDKDSVKGYLYGIRQLGQLKADGTFSWSNSASNWGYGKLSFEAAGDNKIDKTGYVDGDVNNSASTAYYVDNKSVTEDEFNSFSKKQDAKQDAPWHEFSQKNIDAEFQKS